MIVKTTSRLVASVVLLVGLTTGSGVAWGQSSSESTGCPVSQQALKGALDRAVDKVTSGFDNEMWAVVVDRGGVVCAVAFSGSGRSEQWLLSRQIAAAKAFTANGLSLNIDGSGSGPLSTAQLYPLVQPGGSLFGLESGNPLDPAAAYRGPFSRWGTADDPLVGRRVGGTITFGGGVALYEGGSRAVGGLGLSGDTACADDEIAREVRANLRLVPSVSDAVRFGARGQHPSC